jgi:hypothetical protein
MSPPEEVVFIENVYDPDPTDAHYETTVLYLIREQGQPRIETDRWTMGIFSLDTWRAVPPPHEVSRWRSGSGRRVRGRPATAAASVWVSVPRLRPAAGSGKARPNPAPPPVPG